MAAAGTASHDALTVAEGVPESTGGVVSSMVKVAEVVVVLLQASVAVKITVADPVAPQSSLNEVKLWDQVTAPHASDADAPPLVDNHVFKAAVLPAPSHSTV